jgi:hypothetical protein
MLGCARLGSAGVQPAPPAHCPDFSGTYSYPGYEHQADVCTTVTKADFGVGLPIPRSTGWQPIVAATQIRLRQHDCDRIDLYGPAGIHYLRRNYEQVVREVKTEGIRYRVVTDLPYKYSPDYFRVDKWGTAEIDLVPGPRREVHWGEDSVRLRYRFRAEGFGAGWSRNYFTLVLRKLPDGALLYNLRRDEIPGADEEISCTLPPAPEGSSAKPEPQGEGR